MKCVPLFLGVNTTGFSCVFIFLGLFPKAGQFISFSSSFHFLQSDMTNINLGPLDIPNSFVSAFHLPCCFCTDWYCYYLCRVQAFCFVFLLTVTVVELVGLHVTFFVGF